MVNSNVLQQLIDSKKMYYDGVVDSYRLRVTIGLNMFSLSTNSPFNNKITIKPGNSIIIHSKEFVGGFGIRLDFKLCDELIMRGISASHICLTIDSPKRHIFKLNNTSKKDVQIQTGALLGYFYLYEEGSKYVLTDKAIEKMINFWSPKHLEQTFNIQALTKLYEEQRTVLLQLSKCVEKQIDFKKPPNGYESDGTPNYI